MLCFLVFLSFFFFWLHHMARGILVPWPAIGPESLALEAQSLNRWTARGVPCLVLLCFTLLHFANIGSFGGVGGVFLPHRHGVLVWHVGSDPGPLHWKHWVWTTGQPGKSLTFFYKLKVCGNPASSKSTSTIFPTAFAHFVSLCHILVILSISPTLLLYLLW